MVFVDGTNLFHRLAKAKLRLRSLSKLCRLYAQGRQILRVYLYTIEPYYEEAKKVHGDSVSKDIRVVFGDAINSGDGKIREKGVDALLVADLVYHAAAKNYDYAMLISADQDFSRALKRVEDFGCRTGVVSVCVAMPALLRQSCDDQYEIIENDLIANDIAERI